MKMMIGTRNNIVTAIDVGSAFVRVMAGELNAQTGFSLRALVKTRSDGLRNGHIINLESLTPSIAEALREAENIMGTRIRRAIVGISGVALSTHTDTTTVAVSRADSVISDLDVNRAVEESSTRMAERRNVKVIHTIPSEYKIDGKKILGKPDGHTGNRLEVRTLFITASNPHLEGLASAIESAGVEVRDIYASMIAESIVTTTPLERNAGCIIADIGAQTVSLVTYEDSIPTSLKILPIGSNNITNDIALGMRIPLLEAERIKIKELEDRKIAKRINEIVEARVSDILELIDTHLKRLGRSELLPAGIIFTGAGAYTPNLADMASKHLSLPARIAKNNLPEKMKVASTFTDSANTKVQTKQRERMDQARQPEWSGVFGLCALGLYAGPEESMGIRVARETKTGILTFLRQFLP